MNATIHIRMIGLLALVFGTYRTSAQFTFLNDNRYVGVSGSTNGVVVYGQTNYPSVPFGFFNSGLDDSSTPPAIVMSSAGQVSILTSNTIIVTNRISAGYNYLAMPPVFSSGNATAIATFEITFSVQTPTICTLTGVQNNNSLITLPLASLTSTHHGTITTAPTFAQPWNYQGILQPDTYVLNADALFPYTAFGGMMDSGSLTTIIALVAQPVPHFKSVSQLANTVHSIVSAGPGTINRVLATTNLATPLSQWQPVSTNVADNSGGFVFSDTIVPGQPEKFYRISFP
jgi:hypothetical protein